MGISSPLPPGALCGGSSLLWVALHGGFSLIQGPSIEAPSPLQGPCVGLLPGAGYHMETPPHQEFLGQMFAEGCKGLPAAA